MFDIIPFILIFGSLATIIVVVVRKFPQISLLDVDSLPEVQEGKKKNSYLKKRAKKRKEEKAEKREGKKESLFQVANNVQGKFRKYVGSVQEKIHHHASSQIDKKKQKKKPVATEESAARISTILTEAARAYEQEQWNLAEQKYIEVIRLDHKNVDAYRGLVDVYRKQGHVQEAKETCMFLVQLAPSDDSAHARLAAISEELGDRKTAIQHYQQAVLLNANIAERFVKLAELLKQEEQYETAFEAMKQAWDLEKENPRYLDNILDLAILVSDKTFAEDMYQRLRMVNPENQKLETFRQRIAEIA